MTSSKSASARRFVKRIFAEQGIDLHYHRHQELIAFSVNHIFQPRAKQPKNPSGARLIVNILTRFYDIPAKKATELLSSLRQPLKVPKKKLKKGSNLLYMLGRKDRKKFALVAGKKRRSSNDAIDSLNKVLARTAEMRTEEVLAPATPNKRRHFNATHQGPNGTPYKPTMSTHDQNGELDTALLIEASPEKPLPLAPRFFQASQQKRAESFEFSVTQQDIVKRINAQRPCSQQSVMDGYSAADIFEKQFDVKIKSGDRKYFHWAHRQGWCLGGGQIKENLDPATAGSNYTTLFYIESVITDILANHSDIKQFFVSGQVEFDLSRSQEVPAKITYQYTCERGFSIAKTIEPLNTRVPTVIEHEVAKAYVREQVAASRKLF